MVASWKEMANLDAIMGALYHVDHMFLIHMDVKVCNFCREYKCIAAAGGGGGIR